MDWKSCKNKKLAKDVKVDQNLIDSLVKSSDKKLKSQKLLELNEDTASSKITLTYDALRELLEALALLKGFKIYNHECYCYFLKEVLNESLLGDKFNDFRKLRNAINYYGKDVSTGETEDILEKMIELVEEIKGKI